ncbi:MAG: HD domain-containing protein [Paludibacteraceae bacterium]|nr:HD domain-containing protein [Paludibacteraceae bacterium]
MKNKKKIINDPVFGFITLPSEFIYDLLQHPYVHRLTRIKQLGLTSYVYPGTQHTRFQHSLGALHLMTEAVTTLRKKGNEITDAEADAVYAAILLHDIGHGPFSHTLEDFFFDGISHEEVGLAIIKQMNTEFEGRLDTTIEILQNTYPKHFLHELVSGQLDMDRLDYLRRDSFFSGVSEGNIGSARIIKMLNIKDGKLVVEAKGIYSIENFLMTRRLMYWQVYYHKTVFASDIMVYQTLKRARYVERNGGDLQATPSLKYFLKEPARKITPEALEKFRTIDDSDVWVALKTWCNSSDKVLAMLSDGIVNRHLFHIEISNTPFDKSIVEQKTEALCNAYDISRSDAEYLIVENKVSNHMYNGGETAIDILYGNGTTKSIAEASDMFDVSVLERKITKYYLSYYKIES